MTTTMAGGIADKAISAFEEAHTRDAIITHCESIIRDKTVPVSTKEELIKRCFNSIADMHSARKLRENHLNPVVLPSDARSKQSLHAHPASGRTGPLRSQ